MVPGPLPCRWEDTVTPAQRRAARAYQAKHRGSKTSYRTELENALLFLAWEAADLSEGQLAAIFDTDRVTLRTLRDGYRARALVLAAQLSPASADSLGE